VALWEDGESLEELARRADLALYAAKEAGGRRIEQAPRAIQSAEAAARRS
jgi:GGDEF domain-containing protein